MMYVSRAMSRSTLGTRLSKLIDGGRFSTMWIGISVTRLPSRSARVDRHLRMLGRQPLAAGDGAILRAVLRQEDLVAEPERVEPRDQIDDRGVQDPLFVVDGDDDRKLGRAHADSLKATSRPAR